MGVWGVARCMCVWRVCIAHDGWAECCNCTLSCMWQALLNDGVGRHRKERPDDANKGTNGVSVGKRVAMGVCDGGMRMCDRGGVGGGRVRTKRSNGSILHRRRSLWKGNRRSSLSLATTPNRVYGCMFIVWVMWWVKVYVHPNSHLWLSSQGTVGGISCNINPAST